MTPAPVLPPGAGACHALQESAVKAGFKAGKDALPSRGPQRPGASSPSHAARQASPKDAPRTAASCSRTAPAGHASAPPAQRRQRPLSTCLVQDQEAWRRRRRHAERRGRHLPLRLPDVRFLLAFRTSAFCLAKGLALHAAPRPRPGPRGHLCRRSDGHLSAGTFRQAPSSAPRAQHLSVPPFLDDAARHAKTPLKQKQSRFSEDTPKATV